MAEESKKRYFSAIDGLRLLASVNIVLFHFESMGGLYDLKGLPGWLFTIIRGPLFHAGMFFILGGFIFTIKYASKAGHLDMVPFWKKRFQDLYPLHLVTTLLYTLYLVVRKGGEMAWSALALALGIHLSLLYSVIPFGIEALNRPSWALSAFALCYLLFKPMLRWVVSLQHRRGILFLMGTCIIPSVLWSVLYGLFPFSHETYFFFHVFAPIRLFEFLFGMLLARLFILNDTTATNDAIWKRWRDDFLVIALIFLLYFFLQIRDSLNMVLYYMSYHTWTMPVYGVLIYKLCRKRGLIGKLFTFHWVRWIGQSSFYPYLLHVPLIGWTCWFCEKVLGYKSFMHHTYTIFGFMFLLYLGCAFCWQLKRKRGNAGIPVHKS